VTTGGRRHVISGGANSALGVGEPQHGSWTDRLSEENESAGVGPSGEKKIEKRRKALGRLGLHAGNVKRG
jgi:hypothetical protein